MDPERDALRPHAGDALLVVDVQNDFLPGGALAVAGGDEVVPVLNAAIEAFQRRGLPVLFSRDWHPANHCSFSARGGPWPAHCVTGTRGAAFSPALRVPGKPTIISKATQPDAEAYSAFAGTDLNTQLARAGVRRLFLGGLTTDYCVVNTTHDARDAGYDVVVLLDGVRAVNLHPGDGERALDDMRRTGAVLGRGDVDALIPA